MRHYQPLHWLLQCTQVYSSIIPLGKKRKRNETCNNSSSCLAGTEQVIRVVFLLIQRLVFISGKVPIIFGGAVVDPWNRVRKGLWMHWRLQRYNNTLQEMIRALWRKICMHGSRQWNMLGSFDAKKHVLLAGHSSCCAVATTHAQIPGNKERETFMNMTDGAICVWYACLREYTRVMYACLPVASRAEARKQLSRKSWPISSWKVADKNLART